MGCAGAKAGGGKKGGQIDTVNMKTVGVPAMDDVFKNAGEVLNNVIGFNNRLDESVSQFRTLTAMTDAKATLATAFQQFKSQLKDAKVSLVLRVSESGACKLGVDVAVDLIPANLREGYNAAMGLVDNIQTTIEETPKITEQVTAMVDSVKAFTPDKIKEDIEGAGISGMAMVKAVSAAKDDVSECLRAPEILKKLGETCESSLKQIKEGLEEAKSNVGA